MSPRDLVWEMALGVRREAGLAQLTERGSPEQVLFWPQVLAEMRDQYEGPFVKGPLSQRGEKGKIQVAGSTAWVSIPFLP